MRYCNFCKQFPIQTYGPQILWGQFSQKFKKSLKIYFSYIFQKKTLLMDLNN